MQNQHVAVCEKRVLPRFVLRSVYLTLVTVSASHTSRHATLISEQIGDITSYSRITMNEITIMVEKHPPY
jgi:hypothetical protein